MQKVAIIAGAGPAGLTAAYELLTRTGIKPIILEKSHDIGGISKTVNYHGNRIDIGGHRFFSKSDRVMDWWLHILPLEPGAAENIEMHYQQKTHTLTGTASRQPGADSDKTMLIRKRLSRIYYQKKFFDYPVTLSIDTIRKLGYRKTTGILFSYLQSKIVPRKVETLEDFFIQRFGKKLYSTFFRDYTEKVWGMPCASIPAEWGRQRVRTLSVRKALLHALKQRSGIGQDRSVFQRRLETSLIERFLYPRLGPGQLWEEVARLILQKGGEIRLGWSVSAIEHDNDQIIQVTATHTDTGEQETIKADHFFSSMPVKELIEICHPAAPDDVQTIASGLQYRDFMIIGVLVSRLQVNDRHIAKDRFLQDNWIYIQDSSVRMGRIQIFNNWSPALVKDPDNTVWLGLEYFCREGDDLWSMKDDELMFLAVQELQQIGFIHGKDVLDSTVVRVEKAYPAYFGTYAQFDVIKKYTDRFSNLFLIGRNGMHKYNNSDHSMLTAMTAVDNIIGGIASKENIWAVNTGQEYLEQKS